MKFCQYTGHPANVECKLKCFIDIDVAMLDIDHMQRELRSFDYEYGIPFRVLLL